jgi:cell wall assembly regulator SMI1/ankyrin repeat protein
MWVAIAKNDLKTVKALTEAGFAHDELWYHDRTSLHVAIEERKKKIVEYLLAVGADPNVPAKQFLETPLHVAANQGDAVIVQLLLKHGAELSIRNKFGLTAIYDAISKGHLETTRLLVEAGVNIREPLSQRHGSALALAVSRSRNDKLTEYLLQQGCAPNEYTGSCTPLGMAVQQFVLAKKYPSSRGRDNFPHPPNIELLLRHGANPHFRFPDDALEAIRGKTILEHARDEGISPKIVQMLEDAAGEKATGSAKADVPSVVAKGKTKSAPTVKVTAGRLAGQGIASSWKQLRATLSRQAPDVRKSLRAKATPKKLAVLKQELGMEIPEQLVESLEVHDGQTPGAPSLVPREFTSHEYELLSAERIVHEWQAWKELLDSGEFRGRNAAPDAGVRSAWFASDWIPFASDGAGNFLCVDAKPTKKGIVGQVIGLDHESPERRMIAPSIADFLAHVHQAWLGG